MIPVDFPEANRVFNKPVGMTDEECAPLRVHDTGEALISCWQLTPEELAEVARTGRVWLWVHGRGHPPVSIEAASPFAAAAAPCPHPHPPLAAGFRWSEHTATGCGCVNDATGEAAWWDAPPPAAPSSPPALDAFHAHLDACERCRENPFDLCPAGKPLFIAAGEEAVRVIDLVEEPARG